MTPGEYAAARGEQLCRRWARTMDPTESLAIVVLLLAFNGVPLMGIARATGVDGCKAAEVLGCWSVELAKIGGDLHGL